jgi:four helix bundle protein
MMKTYFDHEKLDVYRGAINFCGWVGKFLATIGVKAAAKDQLDRASTSIPLNIAEGNGKFSTNERAGFFEIARRPALECAAALDVRVAWELAGGAGTSAKESLVRIVEMLVGLLRNFSPHPDLLREDETAYGRRVEHEHD